MKLNRKIKSLKVPKPKARNHQMLFDSELPFQPKVIENKVKKYTRNKKHKGRNNDD